MYYNRQVGCIMLEKLKIKVVYNDFIENVNLTDEQIRILNMLINRDTILKISMEIGVSERTISTEVKKLKKLYNDYYALQLSKMLLLLE